MNTPDLIILGRDIFTCNVYDIGDTEVLLILLDGKEVRSCVTPLSMAAGKEVTTVEGLPARWAKQKDLPAAQADKTLHPVQAAWIEEQTPLCGFCQSGMMIKATELLEKTAKPTDAEIKAAFTTSGPSAHLCRCGSYAAILEAVRHASVLMAKASST